jgi:hypothetical protein
MKKRICLFGMMGLFLMGCDSRLEVNRAPKAPQPPAATTASVSSEGGAIGDAPVRVDGTNVVCFVNVGKAVEEGQLQMLVEGFVPSVIGVNTRVGSSESFDLMSRANLRNKETRFGGDAKLFVYVVNDPDLPFLFSVPGYWSVVNIRGLDRDIAGDKEKFQQRLQKVLLKGLGFAAGIGANSDVGRCVMAMGSFETLKGIDSTSASYSPYAAFPMMDIFSAKGLSKADTQGL